MTITDNASLIKCPETSECLNCISRNAINYLALFCIVPTLTPSLVYGPAPHR
jgi:hypothetical protein